MLSNVIYNVKICVHMENGFYLMFLLFKPDQLQSVFKYIYTTLQYVSKEYF